MSLSYNELLEEDKRLTQIIVEKSDLIGKLERENEHLKMILAKQRELLDLMYENIE